MKNKKTFENSIIRKVFFLSMILVISFLSLSMSAFCQSMEGKVIARVEVEGMVEEIGLPIYAHLKDSKGSDYALVISSVQELHDAGVSYTALQELSAKKKGAQYLLAYEYVPGLIEAAEAMLPILYKDGKQILVEANKNQARKLSEMGFGLNWIDTPMVLNNASSVAQQVSSIEPEVAFSAPVSEMVNKVTQNTVYNYTANLTGENTITIGGASYKMESRNTNNVTWQERATQYTYEWFQGKGLNVSYHNWSGGKRNVIAEKTGKTKPSEIVIITGHLDNLPSSGKAPGADDNASGSVGVMVAADILRGYDFERTIRFVLFTGEEQGLLGSKEYALKVKNAGDNIVGVLNLDMIAWDSTGDPVIRIHTRTTTSSGYQADKALADTFKNVIDTYGLSNKLTFVLDADSISYSDHSSFWNQGYPAILGIEDDENDFCANYHTSNDTLSSLNMDYYTSYVKAGVGTIAELAKPVTSTQGPSANFSFTPNKLTVSFKDASSCSQCNISSWNWSFGDGKTSTQENPTYTYSKAGTYSVKLTVSSGSQSDNITKDVTVTDGAGNELVNGKGVSISGNQGEWKHYFITVPSGSSNLVMKTSGGTGDVDLYTKFGSQPTSSSWDCRPYKNGNAEECTVASPQTGKYYVSAYLYSAASEATLTASYETSNPNPGKFSLTTNVSGQGSISLDPPGGKYDSGTRVKVTATPASGYTFSGWSGDLSGSTNPATITMNSDKAITANFTSGQNNQKSCEGRCGNSSADGSCWCDSSCAQYGDCCSDKAQYCGY